MEEEYKPIFQLEDEEKSERIRRIMQRRKEWDISKGLIKPEIQLPKFKKEENVKKEEVFPTLVKEEFPTLGQNFTPVKGVWGAKKLKI